MSPKSRKAWPTARGREQQRSALSHAGCWTLQRRKPVTTDHFEATGTNL